MIHTRIARVPLVVTVVSAALFLVSCPSSVNPGDETVMLPGGVPLEMVWIPAGTFQMGRYPGEQDSSSEEEPQHPVTLTQGFWMGKYELTKTQWLVIMGSMPWLGQPDMTYHGDSPAEYVSWDQAQAFIKELNDYTGLTFRLPSEAEWEYACRAGATTRFYWGDDPAYTVGDDYAWWKYNADDINEDYAHVVGLKLPNAWGLYDMSGNALEWCEDDWHNNYTGAPASGGPWIDSPRGERRVFRGGGWRDSGTYCRSAARYDELPFYPLCGVGFRLAR
jgi:formylglycine-generating enzyme required for sulfatase activity